MRIGKGRGKGPKPRADGAATAPGAWRFPIKDGETALDEAYEGEGNCVIRQLTALYGIP